MPSFAGAKPIASPLAAGRPTRISFDGVPASKRPLLIREVLAHNSTYEPELLPDVPLELDFEFQALPGLMVMQGRVQGIRTSRSRANIAADTTDDIDLFVNLSGQLQVTHKDREIVLAEGEAALVSLADVYSFVHLSQGDLIALRIPRGQFAPLVTGVHDLCYRPISGGTPALKLLIDYLKIARDSQRIGCPELQRAFVRHIHDLMALAVGAARDAAETARAGGLRAARLNALKQDIAGCLDQPDLSVTTLAVRHAMTPRFIQRLFEAEGTTFTEYLLHQRLAHAHRALTDPHREGDKISTVAWDCGFGDVSYFNRAFRRRYDLAPSEVRAEARRLRPALSPVMG